MQPDGRDLLRVAEQLAYRYIGAHAVEQRHHGDIRGDACVVVVELLASWDPAQSAWNTYIWNYGPWRLIDAVRRRMGWRGSRIPPEPVDDADLALLLPVQPDHAEDVIDRLDDERLLAQMPSLLAHLTERQREVLLANCRGESLAAIGARLHVTESGASRARSTALRRLRHLIDAA